MYFKIIIPNYNSSQYIEKCLNSIISQTFKDFYIVIVDDKSEDDSVQKIWKILESNDVKYNVILPNNKQWNGGARNIGILDNIKSEYTLFMDCDDWFCDNNCLQAIYEATKTKPDCVRLPYIYQKGSTRQEVQLKEDTPEKLVNSLYIAPWTKCIKTELVQLFPENTLVEDVVQHIAQCDVLKTVVPCNKAIVVWNRDNTEACSIQGNEVKQNGKRKSSIFRNIADLMDLQCKHDYCENHRVWRINCYMNLLKEGKIQTF